MSGNPVVVEEADRYRIAAPAQSVSAEAWSLEQTLINVCQLLDGWHQDGTAWSTWDEEVRRNVSSHLAIQKSAAQQNAALREELANERANIEALVPENTRLLEQVATRGEVIQKLESEAEAAEAELAEAREELERAKKDLADSRLNHIDANQRNMQAIARAEAAEAELANVKQQLEIAKAGLAALAALQEGE